MAALFVIVVSIVSVGMRSGILAESGTGAGENTGHTLNETVPDGLP